MTATGERTIHLRKQGKFLAALMSCSTISEAGRRAGISERTAERWVVDPDFRERLRAAQTEVIDHALLRIKASTSEALDVLRGIMNDRNAPPGARVQAARSVLDCAIKLITVDDVLSRLEALEATSNEGGAGTWGKQSTNRMLPG